jgi:hypothetical protein
MNSKAYSALIIFSLVISVAISCAAIYLAFYRNTESTDTVTLDYTGKVTQVDHITTTTSGFLFFSGSSRQDTYVTFDNGQTYWKPGYETIVEGQTYHVHTVKTIEYGIGSNSTGPLNKGSTTTIINTFTEVP